MSPLSPLCTCYHRVLLQIAEKSWGLAPTQLYEKRKSGSVKVNKGEGYPAANNEYELEIREEWQRSP